MKFTINYSLTDISLIQGICPGEGRLGPQVGVLHNNTSLDPLERAFNGSNFALGGVRLIKSLSVAIKEFTDREYPDVGGTGLKIKPDLPSPQEGITWEDLSRHCITQRQGGLVQESRNKDPGLPQNRLLDNLVHKFRGEEGERLAVLPLLEWLGDKTATNRDAQVILGQKSTMELFEERIKQELPAFHWNFQSPIEKDIALVKIVAWCMGIDLDTPSMDQKVEDFMIEYVGQLGLQSVAGMKHRLENLPVPAGLNRDGRAQRKKNISQLKKILDNCGQSDFNMFMDIKHMLLRRELNKSKKEHDTIFIKPHHKTIGHVEVKAIINLEQENEVTSALKQLEGGRDEMLRAHGHLLDSEWSYLGIICLPKLPQHLKGTMCRNMHICHYCADFILVGDVNTEMKSLLEKHFPLGSESPDEAVWRKQYKELASRILAMEHLSPPMSMVKRITGREGKVVGGFTEGALNQFPQKISIADAAYTMSVCVYLRTKVSKKSVPTITFEETMSP